MRGRTTIFAMVFVMCAAASAAFADGTALQYPKGRTPGRAPAGLQELATSFDIVPLACSEAEPNETTAQATALSLPGDCNGAASSTDAYSLYIEYTGGLRDGIEDMYVFTLTQNKRINIDLTWSSTSADFDLFVLEKVGTEVDIIDGSATDGSAAEATTTDLLPPGTYYIGVSAFGGSSSYRLAISEQTTVSSCTDDQTTICLNNGRFRVSATWSAGTQSGNAGAVRLTSDTAFLWFFNNANVELVVKVLNACGLNSRYWVFAGGLTDVQFKLSVTDTQTGVTKEYTNPSGQAFKALQDTDAFASCSSCTYGLSPPSQSFTSSGGSGSVAVTTQGGCSWSASSNASWLTLTGASGGVGSGNVAYSVSANTSSSSRTGAISIAGQSVTITQSGSVSGGGFDGTWNGTTSQGKTISFDVVNNGISRINFGYTGNGSCGTVNGTQNVTYQPPRAISGNSFTLTGSGTFTFTLSGTFNTSSSASGSLSFTYNNPFPPCQVSGSGTWSATK